MELTRLTGECPDGVTCPAVFATGDGTLVVQGRTVTADTLRMLRLGADEYAVEIPVHLIREAAQRC
jgi:hypothetical protein